MANILQIQVDGTNYNLVDGVGRNMLATVEESATASKAYAIGELLILNDILYVVTKAIAAEGAIIVTGTVETINVVATKLGNLIVQADWEEANTASKAFIKNKPALGTAAALDAGSANGVAELDANGKVPAAQLPSFVDDVVDVGIYETDLTHAYDADGESITLESGKIYAADLAVTPTGETDPTVVTNKIYRWSGSTLVEISASLVLGEISTTAYRGDRGKVAYDIATGAVATIEASTTASKAYAIGDYLICNNILYRVTAAIAQGATITPGTNVAATTVMGELHAQNVTISVANETLIIA